MRRTRWAIASFTAGLGLTLSAGAVASGAADTPAAGRDEQLSGPSAARLQLATSQQQTAQAQRQLARFHRQRIKWHGCQQGADDEGRALDEAGAQCADITVPLDYARPNRRTTTVAISRMKATDTAHRIGPLILNLGGPGTPVVPVAAQAQEAMGKTGARFDVIGMDPRFVGRSAPFDCGWPASWLPRSAGVDRQSFDRMTNLARNLAHRCKSRYADLLPHISAANIARDMDVIRAALGDSTLSYVGYSQGSYIGALYTQLFPRRANRIVLDSAIDPNRAGARLLGQNAAAREAALREWSEWAATHDAQYHLGKTGPAVIATIKRVYKKSARQALKVGRFTVDDTVVPALLIGPLTDDTEEANAELATTVQVLLKAADNGTAEPTEPLQATLTNMLTGADSRLRSVQTAIMCGDAPVSRNPETYWRDIQAHRTTEPLFGPVGRGVTPCAFWPAPTPPIQVNNAIPTLIVHAAGDINATLEMGQAMHRTLTASRMITLSGVRTHGVYLFQGTPCVDNTVNTYLNTGTLPPQDLTCS